MSRIFLFFLAAAFVFASTTTVHAQALCPKEEIIIFGSAYGYTTTVCNKSGKDCSVAPSSTIVFYQNQVVNVGCARKPNCNSCATNVPQADPKASGNFVYSGRQIFLDTTAGVSKLGNLEFAIVEGDKSDTHYAIFDISVAYLQKDKDPIYFAVPIALQLPSDPGIPGELEAANKTVEGETHLIVTDEETKKERSFKIVDSRGSYGIVKTKLLRMLEKNPVPPAPPIAKPGAASKPATAASRPTPAIRKRPTPVEDK